MTSTTALSTSSLLADWTSQILSAVAGLIDGNEFPDVVSINLPPIWERITDGIETIGEAEDDILKHCLYTPEWSFLKLILIGFEKRSMQDQVLKRNKKIRKQ